MRLLSTACNDTSNSLLSRMPKRFQIYANCIFSSVLFPVRRNMSFLTAHMGQKSEMHAIMKGHEPCRWQAALAARWQDHSGDSHDTALPPLNDQPSRVARQLKCQRGGIPLLGWSQTALSTLLPARRSVNRTAHILLLSNDVAAEDPRTQVCTKASQICRVDLLGR